MDIAFSAIEWGCAGQAYPLLHRAATARPYLPHLYLALADCAAQLDRPELAMIHYEVALHGSWNARYGEAARIAGAQYRQLLQQIQAGRWKTPAGDYAATRLRSLDEGNAAEQPQLMVSLLWNTDRTDVDLHVREPGGEECYYKNTSTKAGGQVTRDVTEGYGPEMYTIGRPQPGSYEILAHFYSTDANRTASRTRVLLSIYDAPGVKPPQRRAVLLENREDKQPIGSIEWPLKAAVRSGSFEQSVGRNAPAAGS
jgi:hypothetical protein